MNPRSESPKPFKKNAALAIGRRHSQPDVPVLSPPLPSAQSSADPSDPPLPLGRRFVSPSPSPSSGSSTSPAPSPVLPSAPSAASSASVNVNRGSSSGGGDIHVVRAETAALDTALREVETLRAHDYQLLKTSLHEDLAALKVAETRVRAQWDAWNEQQRYKISDGFKDRVKNELRAAPLMVQARKIGQQQQNQKREQAVLSKLEARLVEAREDKNLLADELARLRLELSRTRLDTEQASKLLTEIRSDLQIAGAMPQTSSHAK